MEPTPGSTIKERPRTLWSSKHYVFLARTVWRHGLHLQCFTTESSYLQGRMSIQLRRGIPCDEDVHELCCSVMAENGQEFPKDPMSAVNLYVALKQTLSALLY